MKVIFRLLAVMLFLISTALAVWVCFYSTIKNNNAYNQHPDVIESPVIKIQQNHQLQSGQSETITTTTSINGWELIWNDEFDQSPLNRNKWTAENWASEKNNELQFYKPDNIAIENGILKIESRKENFNGRLYTSGAMHTKDKFSFLYGKVEMRAKLPAGQGMFPAFWMMPNKDKKWLPEIDIMEMLGHEPDKIWMVLHWLDDNRRLSSLSDSYQGPNYSENFHKFGIEWDPDQIVWLIDDVERFRTETFIPNEEMYLYVNTAIGGDWPGNPDQTTRFPQNFEIDYIRVFQKREDF